MKNKLRKVRNTELVEALANHGCTDWMYDPQKHDDFWMKLLDMVDGCRSQEDEKTPVDFDELLEIFVLSIQCDEQSLKEHEERLQEEHGSGVLFNLED